MFSKDLTKGSQTMDITNISAEPRQPGKEIHFEVGQELFLDYRPLGNHLRSRLVGIDEDEYLILKNPPGVHSGAFRSHEDGGVVVRFIASGKAYGFNTHILGTEERPANLLFLAYPKDVVERSIRSSDRISGFIPVEIQIKDHFVMGYMKNVSHSGCACAINLEHSPDRDGLLSAIVKGASIGLGMLIIGVDGKQRMNGEIVRFERNGERITLGVSFDKEHSELKAIDYMFSIQ